MKIYITGSVASGKTTLARQMAKTHRVPHYELDEVIRNYKDGVRQKMSPEAQVAALIKIHKAGDYIIEGTYRPDCHLILDLAEEIWLLDTPATTRKKRFLTRFIKQVLGIEACHYKPTLGMLKMMYTWSKGFDQDRQAFEDILRPYMDKVKYKENL